MMPGVDKLVGYKEMVADLKRAPDRPAYILTGEETFLIRQVKDRILSDLIPPAYLAMNRVSFKGDGKSSSLDMGRLLAEIDTPPFMGDKKVICLEETGLFSSALAGGEMSDRLEAALTHLPADCQLIFMEEKLVHNNRLLKKMRQAGALSAKIGRQDFQDLQSWVSGLCHRQGLRITREAADSLIHRCESSMADLMNELSTVFLYFAYKGDKDIGLADIDRLCREDLTGRIFDLTDAIAAGRIDQALEILDVLLARREAPLFIQTMLARQTRDLLVAKECGKSQRILASGLTQSPFFARKLAGQAGRFSLEKLEQMMENCFQADLAVKTGSLDGEEALSILVIRACELA